MTDQTFDLGCGWSAKRDERGGLWVHRPMGDVFIPGHAVPELRMVLTDWTEGDLGMPRRVVNALLAAI